MDSEKLGSRQYNLRGFKLNPALVEKEGKQMEIQRRERRRKMIFVRQTANMQIL